MSDHHGMAPICDRFFPLPFFFVKGMREFCTGRYGRYEVPRTYSYFLYAGLQLPEDSVEHRAGKRGGVWRGNLCSEPCPGEGKYRKEREKKLRWAGPMELGSM